ncbi:MAG: hypothetical protein WC277_04640 [Bacilli bacterium]
MLLSDDSELLIDEGELALLGEEGLLCDDAELVLDDELLRLLRELTLEGLDCDDGLLDSEDAELVLLRELRLLEVEDGLDCELGELREDVLLEEMLD